MVQDQLVAKINGGVVGQRRLQLHQDRVAVLQFLQWDWVETFFGEVV
jgi:hypothetical protein